MSLTARQTWRSKAGGAEANGGGFDPSLTSNMLTDLAATSATGNSPVVSSASLRGGTGFVAGDVGAAVYVAAGTNWMKGWYRIASVAAGAATLVAALTLNADGTVLSTGGIRPNGDPHYTAGCATTASPSGGTFSIDYTWLDTAPFSASDGTSSASTTFTSATHNASWHKGLVGNMARLASGSGVTADYYAITNVTNGTSLTFDRASGTYTAGVFKIGGAHALLNYSTGGSAATPALTSPLAPGHQLFVCGSGTDTPSSADFDLSDGYRVFPSGTLTTGSIKMTSYNGRARISYHGLLAYQTGYWLVDGFYFYQSAGSFFVYGAFGTGGAATYGCNARNCVLDQGGQDTMVWGLNASSLTRCFITDSTNGSAGTQTAVETGHVGSSITGCVFYKVRGPAISLHGRCAYIKHSYIVKGKTDGILQLADDISIYMDELENVTIDGNAGDGINVSAGGMGCMKLTNLLITNHATSGKYGLRTADSLAVNLAIVRHQANYNTWFGNDADFNAWEYGTNDDQLDPQYVDRTNNNYTVGNNMKNTGFPAGLLWP